MLSMPGTPRILWFFYWRNSISAMSEQIGTIELVFMLSMFRPVGFIS